MALSIKHPEADRLARELVAETGESITDAVIVALEERIARFRGRRAKRHLRDDLTRIQARYQRLPLLDSRSADEILGYDDRGMPV
jgi:antitoxin VapB